MNFGLCKNAGGCGNPAACARRAASACEFGDVSQSAADAMDSTMGALDVGVRSAETHAAERAVMFWRRKPYAKRPELVTAAEAMALDEAAGQPISVMHSTRVLELHEAPSVEMATSTLVDVCHVASAKAGWWFDGQGRDTRANPMCFSQKLMLIVSEISEAMEGDRKGLKDDKLPHRDMREVELADALIRICDLAGAYGMDLGGAVAEKLAFNAVRPDHKAEVRAAAGGKAY